MNEINITSKRNQQEKVPIQSGVQNRFKTNDLKTLLICNNSLSDTDRVYKERTPNSCVNTPFQKSYSYMSIQNCSKKTNLKTLHKIVDSHRCYNFACVNRPYLHEYMKYKKSTNQDLTIHVKNKYKGFQVLIFMICEP